METYTPGPWGVEVYASLEDAHANHAFRWANFWRHGSRPACVWRETGAGQTGLPGSVETTEANARLIAAAPEQHEALIEGRAVIAGAINEYGSHPAWEHALKVIDAAIAKAKGEA